MKPTSTKVCVWIDIENPPQVQYLLPFKEAFERRGANSLLTARDYGNALELLEQKGVLVRAVGGEHRRSKVVKVIGVLRRARALASVVSQVGPPDVLVSASRASALAARRLGIPSFIIVDYEYANSSAYRLTGSTILHPDVIDPKPLLASGIRPHRLVAFHGLKEDISFDRIDLRDVVPHQFPEIQDDALVRVLFRPPAETSHYYDPHSRGLALRALEHLAAQPESVVVFVPRHSWQRADLAQFRWRNQPIVLNRPVAFASLLKGIDLVVCAGGTMLREAAYLGVPAYSILKSRIGGVDRYLASLGRVRLISSPDELPAIALRKAPSLSPLRTNPALLDELVEVVWARVTTAPLSR